METRAAILVAARAAVARQGFAATSLDEIRRAAAVSNGSLFHHFPTKGHLARALYLEAVAEYQGALRAALRRAATAEAGVTGMVEAHVTWVLAHRDSARVLLELREAAELAGAAPDLDELNGAGFAEIGAFVAAGVARGELAALPFEVWMALVFAPVLALTRRWVQRPEERVAPSVRRALARAAFAAVAAPSVAAPASATSPRRPRKRS